jgi:hypothetical protein
MRRGSFAALREYNGGNGSSKAQATLITNAMRAIAAAFGVLVSNRNGLRVAAVPAATKTRSKRSSHRSLTPARAIVLLQEHPPEVAQQRGQMRIEARGRGAIDDAVVPRQRQRQD